MTDQHLERVVAVVVTYLPEAETLMRLLKRLVPQVTRIFVVDNSPRDDGRAEAVCREADFISVDVIRLGRNFGIAKAFNVGIEAAKLISATHVLLSDQDSEPACDMVAGLIRAEADLQQHGCRIGAIGPSFTNTNSGDLFPFHVERKGHLFYGRQSATLANPHVEALSLISSGTLIPIAAINAIGMMREDFFIDSVDTEWCYRARSFGFHLYGTGWATMLHHMGDSRLRVWYFGWVKANAHNPMRIYYQVRNLVRLQYLGFNGVRWRVKSAFSIMSIFYCHVFFGDNRFMALRLGVRGLTDGIRGRMGEFKL